MVIVELGKNVICQKKFAMFRFRQIRFVPNIENAHNERKLGLYPSLIEQFIICSILKYDIDSTGKVKRHADSIPGLKSLHRRMLRMSICVDWTVVLVEYSKHLETGTNALYRAI